MPKAKSTPQERLNAAVERYLKAVGYKVLGATTATIESPDEGQPFNKRLVVGFIGKEK